MANIWNNQAIDDFLSEIAEEDPELLAHLKTALKKPLQKEERCIREITEIPKEAPEWLDDKKWEEGGPWSEWKASGSIKSEVQHIRDWIKGAMFNEAPWIKNTDDKGRPFNLMNISTLEQATVCADRAMHELSIRYRDAEENEGDTKVVKDFGNGFVIVELMTSDALKRESGMMGHCIGDGGHDEHLGKGKRRFYSLRDERNKAHVTFDVDEAKKALIECKGKGNAPPISKYMPMVKQFITEKELKLEEKPRYTNLIDLNGELLDVTNLPDNLELTPREYYDLLEAENTVFPDNIRVIGDIDYYDSPEYNFAVACRNFPKNMVCTGSILVHTAVSNQYFADNLVVEGDFRVSGDANCTLPSESIQVKGNSEIHGDKDTVALPPQCHFVGSVILGNEDFDELSQGFFAEGGLIITNTRINKIPDNATILNFMECDASQIRSMGIGVTIASDLLELICDGTVDLPENLTLIGDTDLGGLSFTPFAAHTTLKGNLDLENIRAYELPEHLTVEGNINMVGSTIDSIPPTLKCSGFITLPNNEKARSAAEAQDKMKLEGNSVTPLTPAYKEALEKEDDLIAEEEERGKRGDPRYAYDDADDEEHDDALGYEADEEEHDDALGYDADDEEHNPWETLDDDGLRF